MNQVTTDLADQCFAVQGVAPIVFSVTISRGTSGVAKAYDRTPSRAPRLRATDFKQDQQGPQADSDPPRQQQSRDARCQPEKPDGGIGLAQVILQEAGQDRTWNRRSEGRG